MSENLPERWRGCESCPVRAFQADLHRKILAVERKFAEDWLAYERKFARGQTAIVAAMVACIALPVGAQLGLHDSGAAAGLLVSSAAGWGIGWAIATVQTRLRRRRMGLNIGAPHDP